MAMAPDSDLPSFGALLKAFRKRRHLTQQHLADALGMHRDAVGRWERGDFLPASKTTVLEVARQLHLDEAEPLAERTVHLFEQALGPEHPLTAMALGTLADLYREQGRYELAQPIYQRSLRHLEQTLGAEHPQIAYALEGLANLLRKQGDNAGAESYYQRALSIRERHLGQHHPETAQTVHELAILRQQQGNLNEACALAEQALAIRSRSLGDLHPKTRATRTLHAELVLASAQREAQADSRQPRRSSTGGH
ncbi:MAG: tetratricopeptide repeat protein [Ktedonobacterales bacterium]